MEPLIARGFVTLLLTPTRIAQIKDIEQKMDAGRYLQAFEILAYYDLSGGEIEVVRENKMKELLHKWRVKNNMDGMDFSGTTYMHGWMDFVQKNWFEPLPVAKRRITDKFEAGVLLAVLMLCN